MDLIWFAWFMFQMKPQAELRIVKQSLQLLPNSLQEPRCEWLTQSPSFLEQVLSYPKCKLPMRDSLTPQAIKVHVPVKHLCCVVPTLWLLDCEI